MNTTAIKNERSMCGPKGKTEEIVFIEYDKEGRPFSVGTNEKWDHRQERWFKPEKGYDGTGVSRNDYAFDWCISRQQLYQHLCGSGYRRNNTVIIGRLCNPEPPCLIWLAEGQKLVCQDYKKGKITEHPLTQKQVLARGFKIIKQPLNIAAVLDKYTREKGEAIYNPFEDACESETEYCSICNDRFPDDESCRHLFWSSGGYWSGIGSYEGKIDDAKEDILFFASKIKTPIVVEMIKALESNSFWLRLHGSILGPVDIELTGGSCYIFNILDGFDEDQLKSEEEYSKMQDGGYWLVSLEAEKTKEANAKVVKWLRQGLITKHKHRTSTCRDEPAARRDAQLSTSNAKGD